MGGARLLHRVAIVTARDEVAIRIGAELRQRGDVVDAPPFMDEAAQTIEATTALAGVDGTAERLSLQEVDLFEASCARSLG